MRFLPQDGLEGLCSTRTNDKKGGAPESDEIPTLNRKKRLRSVTRYPFKKHMGSSIEI
jgi:hypothetical protein